MKMNKNLIIIVLAVLIAGGIGFFGGTKYQQSRALANFANRQGGTRFGMGQIAQRMMGGNNFRPVMGEIISQDDKSITVKLTDGSSKIILLSDSTTFNKISEAAKTDLKVGDTIAAFGTTSSDGSIVATSIQLNPTTSK
jgi:hypothetical protein